MSEEIIGQVYKTTGSWYYVKTESQQQLLECKLKGKLKLKGFRNTNPVVVGDYVRCNLAENQTAVISEILPRTNYIIRRATKLSKESHIIAANIDEAFLIITNAEPRTPLGFIDRFLVAAGGYHIPVTLVFNKADLYDHKARELNALYKEIYGKIGYRWIEVSAKTGLNIDALREQSKGKLVLFSGQSGVGKSAIINCLQPGLNLKEGEISGYNSKGKHTTTFAEIFDLSYGARLIDTPGIKEFGMINFEKPEISHYFPEMLALLHQCRFNNCLHLNEPGCAVREALHNGQIAPSRYQNYIAMLNEEEEL